MYIHEYQAKELCLDFGINVPRGIIANNINEAVNAAKDLGGNFWAIKAQIHAGGRGLGGGIKMAKNINEVEKFSDQILGMTLVTPQTSPNGKVVKKIYIEQGCKIKQEFYLSLTFDRTKEQIRLLASANGGVNIQGTSQTHPELIKTFDIDPQIGIMEFHSYDVGDFFGFDNELNAKLYKFLFALYKLYMDCDAVLVEINPLVLTYEKELFALDAKMIFDDSALYRQKKIALMRDDDEDSSEIEAKKFNLSYVKLDGNIGCMVNGAGLAMGVMDTIAYYGGKSANFLDIGGNASPETVAKAFEIILRDKNVKSIFVNIFGGIVRCDRVAEGILEATRLIFVDIPVVVRLNGTNALEAQEILKQANIKNIFTTSDLEEGTKLAIKLANGIAV